MAELINYQQYAKEVDKVFERIKESYLQCLDGNINHLEQECRSYKKLMTEAQNDSIVTARKHAELCRQVAGIVDIEDDNNKKFKFILGQFPDSLPHINFDRVLLGKENAGVCIKMLLANYDSGYSYFSEINAMLYKIHDSKFSISMLGNIANTLENACVDEESVKYALAGTMRLLPCLEFVDIRDIQAIKTVAIRIIDASLKSGSKIKVTTNSLRKMLCSEFADIAITIFNSFDISAINYKELNELYDDFGIYYTNEQIKRVINDDKDSVGIETAVKFIRNKLHMKHSDDYGFIIDSLKDRHLNEDLVGGVFYGNAAFDTNAVISFAESIYARLNKINHEDAEKINDIFKSLPNAEIIMQHLRSSRKTSRALLEIDMACD